MSLRQWRPIRRRASRVHAVLRAGFCGLFLLCLCAPVALAAENDTASGYVNFSFDQVDVASFVKLVGDLTNRRFVLGDGVDGKITVVSPRVRRSEVYPLFISILESVGCSVVVDGDLHRVVALAPRGTPAAPVLGPDEPVEGAGVVTKVIRLEHVTAAQLRGALESSVRGGKQGGIEVVEETNHLIITDTAEAVRRVERIVEQIDRPGSTRTTEVVRLQYASADILADQLNAAVAEAETRGQRLAQRLPQVSGREGSRLRAGASIVAAPHVNSLILVGSPAQIQDIRDLIRQMDIDAPAGRGSLNAIFLKYLSAEEAASSINGLLEKAAATVQEGQPRRRMAIQADAASNALLIDASPSDFDVVRRLVDQLDQLPRQVHITVVIAEVSRSADLEIGVEMAALDMPDGPGDTVVQGSSTLEDGANTLLNAVQQGILPGGLTIGVAYGTRINADGEIVTSYPGIINVDATDRKAQIDIVSETSLETQNNREAAVNIVNEIPVLKSTIQGGSGSARDVIQNIERMEVGIKLKLTPHIIPGGEVQMDLNPSIEAVVDSGSGDTAFTPTIARREVSTTVTVPDGEMIVIAGLTRTDQQKVDKRVPILGYIPLLGRLFTHTVDSNQKTDLLIFVTPRVVDDILESRDVMRDWQQRTGFDDDDRE